MSSILSTLYKRRVKSSFPLTVSSLYSQLHPSAAVIFAGPQQSTVNSITRMPKRKSSSYKSGSKSGSSYKKSSYKKKAKTSYHPRTMTTEVKSVDLSLTTAVFNTTGTITLLNGIAEGSGFYNRIGRKIVLKSLYITGAIAPVNTSAITQSYCRLIVIYDAQTNGAAPTWANVIQSYTAAGTPTSLYIDQFNLDNRDRFRILADRRWDMPGTTGSALTTVPAGNSSHDQTVKMYIKLRGLETQYKSSSSTVSDIATGSIYLLTCSDNSHGTNYYQVSYSCRCRYTDN